MFEVVVDEKRKHKNDVEAIRKGGFGSAGYEYKVGVIYGSIFR